jgi:hypothetical protein
VILRDAMTSFERAFQLAESGQMKTVEAIRNALVREGHRDADALLSGRYLIAQLTRSIEKALRRDHCDAPANPST